jgi:hypothetical protein
MSNTRFWNVADIAPGAPTLRPYTVNSRGRVQMICAPTREDVEAIVRCMPAGGALIEQQPMRALSADEARAVELDLARANGRRR